MTEPTNHLPAGGKCLCWKKETMQLNSTFKFCCFTYQPWRSPFWQLQLTNELWQVRAFPFLPSPPYCDRQGGAGATLKGEAGSPNWCWPLLHRPTSAWPSHAERQQQANVFKRREMSPSMNFKLCIYPLPALWFVCFFVFTREIKCLTFVPGGLLLLSCQYWLCYTVGVVNTSGKMFQRML